MTAHDLQRLAVLVLPAIPRMGLAHHDADWLRRRLERTERQPFPLDHLEEDPTSRFGGVPHR